MAEKNYKELVTAKEKYDKTIAAATEEYETAGASPVNVINLKRRGGKITKVRVN